MAIVNRSGLEGHDDFLGFTFNGRHSSEFHIIRVSQNNAYSDVILPNSRDVTTEIVGRDGLYHFGSSFEQRQFSISIAFDDLHEEQFSEMTAWLAKKSEGELTFDERPYKTYMGKISSTPTLNYICFDDEWQEEEEDPSGIYTELDARMVTEIPQAWNLKKIKTTTKSGRTYKGTGTIQFTCFYPWAYAKYKTIPEYSGNGMTGTGWEEASHILESLNRPLTPIDSYTLGHYIDIYNAGQMPTPFKLIFTVANNATGNLCIMFKPGWGTVTPATATEIIYIKLDELGQGTYMFDTELHLILECESGSIISDPVYTGKVCNYSILAGDFFELPAYDELPGYNTIDHGTGRIQIAGYEYVSGLAIQYNYRYY